MEFEPAWAGRVTLPVQGQVVGFLGREAMLANKRASGRDKDLLDVKLLEQK